MPSPEPASGRPDTRIILAAIAAALLGSPPASTAGDVWSTFIDGSFQQGIAGDDDSLRIWVASTGGAMAFAPGDSTYRRLFRNDGLESHDLTAVAVDGSGHRWFGSRGAGLQVQAASGGFLRRPLDRFDLGSDSVRVLLPVNDQVWVGTASGAALVRYPPDPAEPGQAVLATINLESILGRSPLVNGIASRSDTTWFGTQRGVVRREPDGSRAVVNAGLSDLDVRALIVVEGFLWAGTATTVYRFENGRWEERADGLVTGRPYLSFAVHAGSLYVGAQVMGTNATAYRFDGAAWMPAANGLADRDVNGLVSLAGSLWAATTRGLHVLGANQVWRRIPAPDPPRPESYAIIDNDYRDVAVIPGTVRARAVTRPFVTELVAETNQGANFVAIRRGEQGVEARDFATLHVDGSGVTWLGHCCCGTLTTCRGERLSAFTGTAEAFAAWDVFDIVETPDGAIWMASVRAGESQGQGLFHIDPATGTVTNYTEAEGLASGSVQALAVDSAGRLWIGYTDRGADLWRNPGRLPASITHLDTPQGLPSSRVTALAANGGEVWVGTVSGIAAFVGSELIRVIPGSVLPNALVNALAADGCQRMWVGTPAGAAALDREGRILSVVSDATRPGLAAAAVNAIAVERETAVVWFATQGGLSRLAYDASCAGGSTGGGGEAACTQLCPYPNPFRPGEDDGVRLAEAGGTGEVRVTVIDAAGREVRTLVTGAGGIVWDGRDEDGGLAPSGVYLLRILPTSATCNCAPAYRPVAVQR